MTLSDQLKRRREWECPEGCGEQYWAHQLYGDYDYENGIDTLKCPPPPEPRDCCGRMDTPENNETRVCSNGPCTAWWCVCGTFTGMSAGLVRCGCEYDRGEVSTDPPKRS